MASNKFAESVINGTYKKNKREEDTTRTSNATPTSNNFAESVINGTYKSPKTIDTKTTPTISEPITTKDTATNDLKSKVGATITPGSGYKMEFDNPVANLGAHVVTGGKKAINTVADVGLDFLEGGMGYLEGAVDWGTYRLADAADLLGGTGFAEDLRKNADFDSTGTWFGRNQNEQENIFGNWQAGIEENSLSPDYVDNLFKGVGQIGTAVATSALTGQNPFATAAITYTSSYGNARSEAKRNGATDREANRVGMIHGIAETISENIFSGAAKLPVVGGWGSKAAGKITGKITSATEKYFGSKVGNVVYKALDTLAESVGEGSEEIISNILVAVGNDIMHSIDNEFNYGMEGQSGNILEDLIDQATSKDSWDQFFSAALTSAIVGSVKGVIDTKTENKIISAYAQDNKISFEEAKRQLAQMQQQQNQGQQQETPQIQQNEQENINNQPITEQPQIEPKQANNEAIDTEQNLINEINNEQRKLDNGTSEDDGYHLAELQKELQEVQQKSIANDSNTFNLGKIDENNTLRSIRTKEDISNRKTNAYQYDNPEVKPYFKDAALDLRDALENYTTKGERWEQADGTWTGTKFSSTPEITKLKDKYNMSYKDLDRGIEGIIKDKGAENNAASKKVELVIDDMLRNGYKSIDPNTSNPNQNYLDTLAGNFDASTIELEPTDEIPFPHTMQDEIDMGLREPLNNNVNANQQTIKQEQPTQNDNIPETKQEDVLKVAEQEPVKVDLGGKDVNDSKINKVLNKLQGNKDRYIALDNGDNVRNTVQEEFNNRNEYLNDKINEIAKKELTPKQEEQHFIDSGVEPKVAKILSEMPKPEKVSLRDKVKNGKATLREEWSYFKRNFVDKGETIYTLAKKLKKPKLYATYDKMGTTRGEANYSVQKAQTDLKGKKYNNFTDKNGKKVSMSLNQIWDGIDAKAANQYLAHWLNVDRYNQQTEDGQNKYVFGTPDINPEISQQRIAELEKAHPELKRFGENIWQYGKNMLQNMVDGGLVNEQQAKQFMQETPHYVRLQRNVDTNTKTALEVDKNGKVAVNKPTKQEFKGSDIDILPFKNSMAEYTFDVAKAIRTNLFAQELAKSMSVSSTDNNVSSLDDSFGVRPDLLQDNGNGTYSLTLFNNGVATVIPIDQGIYESLTPNKHYKFEDTIPFKAIRKIDNFRKALLTDKNPMFLATNMMKDLFDAPLNSKYPTAFAKNYPRAIWQVLTKGKYYQQYQALGGLQNSYFEKGEFKKDGSKFNPLTWIERANNAIEQFPRLAEFISTMQKTGDIDLAMYNAAEITTNFKRGGDVTKAANRNGVTFLNASVQGFSKQVRNFTDIFSKTDGKLNVDKKQAVQLLGKIVALGIAPALINDMIYGDDDEYKEMQDYIKDRYYLIKGFNGDWIRIPKGRALSVFQSAARRTGYALDGDKNAFKDFVNFASTQVAPNNPFENNIISPFVDVARNESWSGSKIVSDSLAKRPEAEQYNEKTDELSKWLGGMLNVSPMKINYLIDQYSGGVGDVLLPTITPKTTGKSSNPVEQAFASKFTVDPVYSNKNVGVFYDTMDELEKKRYSIKANSTDKLKYSYIYSQNQKMSDLRKEQSLIQSNSSLSNKEKYEKARNVQKQINELAKQSVKDLDNIQDNTYYAKVGDNIYYLDEDGTFKKDGYAESHQKSAEKKGMALYDYYKEQYEKRKEKNKE